MYIFNNSPTLQINMHLRRKNLSVFVAYLLLFAFSAIQVTEVLHNHVDDHHVPSTVSLKQQDAELSLADALQKCKICKDLSNRQIAFEPLEVFSYNFSLNIPAEGSKAVYKQKLFETAVSTWTNKGPPMS